jgi:hypothetical protein
MPLKFQHFFFFGEPVFCPGPPQGQSQSAQHGDAATETDRGLKSALRCSRQFPSDQGRTLHR